MNFEWTIREARLGDIDELVRLCAEHAAFERSDFTAGGKAETYRAHLFGDTPSVRCIVAESAPGLVGYATFMKQFSTWDAEHYVYMDCLFLRPVARNHGIGVELMRRIEAYARENGCGVIQCQTPAFNTRAMPFYKRMGGVGKDKVRYFLDVPPA